MDIMEGKGMTVKERRMLKKMYKSVRAFYEGAIASMIERATGERPSVVIMQCDGRFNVRKGDLMMTHPKSGKVRPSRRKRKVIKDDYVDLNTV